MSERPLAQRRPAGAPDDAPEPEQYLSHQEARDAEYSRVMASKARDREVIKRLTKLLLREIVRHRKAGRWTNAKDIEVALHQMDVTNHPE